MLIKKDDIVRYNGYTGLVLFAPLRESAQSKGANIEVEYTNSDLDIVVTHVDRKDLKVQTPFRKGDKVMISRGYSNEREGDYEYAGKAATVLNTASNYGQVINYDIELDVEGVPQGGEEFSFAHQDISLIKQTKTKKETKLMSNLKEQGTKNKEAAILAARITAGKAINKKVIKMVKPKLPMMARGYADSPFASVVLANIVGMAIKQYAPDNKRAEQIADLMLEASAFQAIEGFDVEGMIDDLLKGVKLPKLEKED